MDSEKILLVDDDALVLATFGKGLKNLGYDIYAAENGKQGLIIAAENPSIDLAILDMYMPGISGIEAAQGLAQLNISSIFLSAYDDKEVVTQAIDEGAMGYLVKPIDVDKAVPTIEAAIKRAKEIRSLVESKEKLSGALETGNLVNVVVGMLMERHRLNRQEAYEILRQKARSERRKVKRVAEEALTAWETFNSLVEK